LSSAKPAWTDRRRDCDARTESLADVQFPQIYRSVYSAPPKTWPSSSRTTDPSAISAQMREQVQSADATLPVFQAETLDDVLSTSLSIGDSRMEMVAFFAATALLLAGWNLREPISYVVNEQRREMAIARVGAQRGTILKMVLRRGLGLAALAPGWVWPVPSSSLTSWRDWLYGVSSTDLPTFAGVTLVLTRSRSPPAISLRCAPCASIQSLHSTPE